MKHFSFQSFFIFLLPLCFHLSSCYPPGFPEGTETKERATVVVEDTDTQKISENRNERRPSRNRGSCRRGGESDIVSVRSSSLEYVDSQNVGNYTLKGRCDLNKHSVSIEVNGHKISNNPVCDGKRWQVTLDLSAVANSEENIAFEIEHDGDTICEEVRVAFISPENYIPVSARKGYYEYSFFVMKYEAKIEGKGSSSAKAVSKPEDKPVTQVNYNEAFKLCRNNGPRYTLMENSQWQNIALSIEETNSNWSSGRHSISDNNFLNCGISSGSPKPAHSNDSKDCAVTSCNSGWDVNRRTHTLVNGQVIWDMCGNVGELMRDEYTETESFSGYIYKLDSRLKKLFGPKKNYEFVNADRRVGHWGLGYADINPRHNMIVRGAGGRIPGLFSVSVKHDQEGRSASNVGFRCVYLP